MLARNQLQPCRALPAIMKIMAMPQRRHEGRGAQGPNPLHLLEPLTRLQLVTEARELTRDLGHPGIERTQRTLQALQEVAHQEGYAIVCLLDYAGQALAEAGNALGNDNTVLQEEPADLIHHRRAVLHEPLPDAMQALESLLLNSFYGHGRDVGPLARFRQRQRIMGIIFLPPADTVAGLLRSG